MHLLFDLDGTLTDPFPGITTCIQHGLISLGQPAPAAEQLRWCIGPPLKQSFVKLLGPDLAHLADEALAKYRERFGAIGLFENALYPGIEAALDELKLRGYSLRVATSKPTIYATRIIAHFGLNKYFISVDGSELDGTRANKTDLIAYILKREAINPQDAIMIGDREHDMIGARNNRVTCVGALWGYGSKEELEIAGAHVCVASLGELPRTIRLLSQSSIS